MSSNAAPLRIRTYQPASGRVIITDLPLRGPGQACPVRLRSLSGASALHLPLLLEEAVLLRAEAECHEEEEIEIEIRWIRDRTIQVAAAGRRVFTFPPEEDFGPRLPLRPACDGERLDLIVVVDATTRCFGEDGNESGRLLEDRPGWNRHAQELAALAESLSGAFRSSRWTVIAFGDEAIPKVSAVDLTPRFRIHPPAEAARQLAPDGIDELRSALGRIPVSSGGDFVDSLADALHVCSQARWHPDARKLVIVSGDSPGYSIIQPPPWGSNASLRAHDVESQAASLQALGVEILAVYHEAPSASGLYQQPEASALLEYARAQYQALASRRGRFFHLASRFQGRSAAKTVLELTTPLVRGAGLGELLAANGRPAGDSP